MQQVEKTIFRVSAVLTSTAIPTPSTAPYAVEQLGSIFHYVLVITQDSTLKIPSV